MRKCNPNKYEPGSLWEKTSWPYTFLEAVLQMTIPVLCLPNAVFLLTDFLMKADPQKLSIRYTKFSGAWCLWNNHLGKFSYLYSLEPTSIQHILLYYLKR